MSRVAGFGVRGNEYSNPGPSGKRSARGVAHGKGLILPKEMPIDAKTNTTKIRYAPAFGVSANDSVAHAYTIESLAKFLGFIKSGNQEPTNSFIAAFGAEELIAEPCTITAAGAMLVRATHSK